MRDAQGSAGYRMAAWLARGAVRAWPEESRKWGLALEAELHEIEGPGASLRWAIGGVMLLTRAWWNHFLRSWIRPAGVPESGPLADLAKNAARVPRTPRFVTALFLLASMAVLLVPDVRDGINATFDAWAGRWDRWDEKLPLATLTRLRQEIGQSHDPQVMALVAIVSDDHVERVHMADEAVRLDPSLTWIYSEVRTTDGLGSCCNGLVPPEWVSRLQKWDPDNAVPRILAAQQNMLQFEQDWQKNGYGGDFDQQAKLWLVKDPQWLAAMDSAFQSPKYDSYSSRAFDLYRAVVARYGIQDRQLALAVVNRMPFFIFRVSNARVYGEILQDRADAIARAGKDRAAMDLYLQAAQFAERMAGQSHVEMERSSWINIERRSLLSLQLLIVKSGQTQEAVHVGYKLEGLQTDHLPYGPEREWAWNEHGWEGFTIRLLTGGILLLGAGSLLSICALFIGRRVAMESRGRGLTFASVLVDYCPLLMLLACAGLFVAYRPIELMYEQYMQWPYPIYDFRGLTHALATPYESPDGVWGLFYDYLNPVHYWMALIVGLSILAFYILFRGTMRRREAIS